VNDEPMELLSRRIARKKNEVQPADTLREKYLRVLATPDGMDVFTDIMLRAYWVGTLDNPSKVALHNLANELFAFVTDTERGGDYETPAYSAMLRAAIGSALPPTKPPNIREGAHDRGRP
jgi:hypothetical protein